MELYQLHYFQAVAETGTLRDAAEQLAVSQSSVSRAITMLESEIGVELFTWRGRAKVLNRFGKAFLRSSLAVQRSLETAVADVRQLAGVDAGTVALGFLTSLGVTMVPRLIRRHHDRYPAARFELRSNPGRALVRDLCAGVVDICLGYPMAFDELPGVKWHCLFTQPLVAVVNRHHPLADRKLISFDELADQPFVALDQGYVLRRIFDDACSRHDITPTIAFEGTDMATLRGLIGSCLGVGIMPRAPTPVPEVVEIPVDDEELVRPIAIGWMANRYLPASAAAFRDTAIASYGMPDRDAHQAPRCGPCPTAQSSSADASHLGLPG
ncbi:LysR family transcriptional regulator [Mycobacterium riyadhense]|uniref:HTH-type transcriptional regulator GltC n=1 Tax=Mycobacterium riyadhense TaxID=486698 RepID=A0A653EIS9_9MYCO|nr:LysR family transcriptional regulator [Mycobacterium riyadhense]VTO97433.1 HTH-type transcriptional regulator GltC [Mycobacterium riyadhense]